jgi:hypothetical protein
MARTMGFGPARIARRGAAIGMLWGVGVAASEALALPFGQLDTTRGLVTLAPIIVSWMIEGMLLAAFALAIEPWLDKVWKVALAILVAALGTALLDQAIWRVTDSFGMHIEWRRLVGQDHQTLSSFLYIAWMTMFHGGLFIVACVIVSRTERGARALGDVEIARDRTQALLDDALLDSLRSHTDPAFLMRALAAVRDRYASADDAADRLLDQLVAFLRLAMPGVGSGRSTLPAEVALAGSYAALAATIEPERALWRVRAHGPVPDLAFPPLLLVPLMESLAGPASSGPSTLWVEADSGRIRIVADPHTFAPLPPMLRYRLRVALQAAFGDAWQITGADGVSPSKAGLVIEIGPGAIPAAPSRLHDKHHQRPDGAALQPAALAGIHLAPGALP